MVVLVRYYLPKSKLIETRMEIYCSTTANNANITANPVQVEAGPSQVEVDDPNELVIEEEVGDGSENFPVLRGGKADLFKLLHQSFKDFQIPERNIIGFVSDGANVMFGEKNSVVQRFCDEFPVTHVCVCQGAVKILLEIFKLIFLTVLNEKRSSNSSRALEL